MFDGFNTENEHLHRIDSRPVIVDNEHVQKNHVTTRPHNRKIIYDPSSGYWYVFYGHGNKDADGKYRISWRSSKDGVNWSDRHTLHEGNAHASSLDVLLSGDTITAMVFRPHYHRALSGVAELYDGKEWWDRPEDDFPMPYEIMQMKINNGDLSSGPIYTVIPGTTNAFAHYGSLTRDTAGFFWVGARIVRDGEGNPFQAVVVRSEKAGDISAWQPYTSLFRASGKGTVTVQVIALDDGKVFTVIFSQSDIKVYGSLYDPEADQWESPYIIAEGNSKSKRAVAAFDPSTRRLHLIYINNASDLRHKILSYPYSKSDWLPNAGNTTAGIKIDSDVVTKIKRDNNFSLSIDTSRKPASLAVAYHKGTPHYRMKRYDGEKWGNAFLVGMQDPERIIDEISMIRDYSDKLGLIYYVLPDGKRGRGEIHFMEIPKNDILLNKGR
ncbi:MAG TPA: hypothetical protein ENH23_04580 [candidate division Zixibacteria bacterium]|nr:hypothetical protein [candidate division Zixibacteria bacterium]